MVLVGSSSYTGMTAAVIRDRAAVVDAGVHKILCRGTCRLQQTTWSWELLTLRPTALSEQHVFHSKRHARVAHDTHRTRTHTVTAQVLDAWMCE
eukprot:183047-Chlamydomonas_euryale.AAC.1